MKQADDMSDMCQTIVDMFFRYETLVDCSDSFKVRMCVLVHMTDIHNQCHAQQCDRKSSCTESSLVHAKDQEISAKQVSVDAATVLCQ